MQILRRAGALLAVNLLLQLVEALLLDDGPHIGLGLAWFVLCIAISAAWAHRDGRGAMAVRDVVILWSVVAVVAAVGAAVLAAAFGDGFGGIVTEVVTMLPLAVFIVLLPATIGGLLGDKG